MASFEVRRSLKSAARAFLLAAVAAPCAALSQALPESATERQLQIIERIEQETSRNGPHSEQLIGPLTALALFYQENGDRALAAATLERVRQVVRVNYGLYTLEQAPFIQQLIDIAEQIGDVQAAWDVEQELIAVTERHPSDMRTAAILREVADKRMAVLERFVDGEFPEQIVLGCYYQTDDCVSGSRTRAVASLLAEAQGYYADAIKAIIGNDGYSSDELRELELELIRSSFLYGAAYGDGRDYAIGRDSLRRLAAYEAASSAPPSARIDALIRLADWDVLFSRSRELQEAALTLYEQAYRRLASSGASQATIDAIFSPETPVVLPAFLPNPFAAAQTSDSTAYIDVSFEVTKGGRARRVDILETTNVERADERHAVELILRSRFRPRVVNGEFADAAPIVARYYPARHEEAP